MTLAACSRAAQSGVRQRAPASRCAEPCQVQVENATTVPLEVGLYNGQTWVHLTDLNPDHTELVTLPAGVPLGRLLGRPPSGTPTRGHRIKCRESGVARPGAAPRLRCAVYR